MNELIQAWYDLLDGALTYNGKSVEVFKEDVPEDHPASSAISDHYVWIHGEGGTDDSNKSSFVDNDVVIIDIVTVFENNVNRLVCETVDAAIRALVYNSPSINNLSESGAVQFGQTKRETYSYVTEDDGVKKYYRKVSRYSTRLINV